MQIPQRIGLVLIFLLVAMSRSFATESPRSLAEKLQTEYLAAPEVSLSFDLQDEGHIRVLVDLRNGRIRLESAKLLILSDGKTVWNYDKASDRVTIDNVTSGSEFRDPASLFRFADNYTALIEQAIGNRYTMILTPVASLRSLLHNAGEIRSLRLNLMVKDSRVSITNASASSTRGTANVEHLEIKMLRTVTPSDFIFNPQPSTKIVDLRE